MRDTRRARLTLGLLLAVALVLITIDHRQREDSLFEPVRSAAASLFGVAERAGAGVARPIGDFIDTFASAAEYKREVTAVRAENSRLRQELTARSLDRHRSAQLTSMLGLSGLGGYRVVAAQVIARRGVPGFEDAVEIDAGSSDGVRPEMTVINGDGLVGRVVHTGTGTATVVLLTDPASAAGARLEGSNEIGVVTGLGPVAEGRLLRFRMLDSAATPAAGRRLVSFGSQHGKPYAPGVPVGVIQRVEATPGELTRVAYARPFVAFTALDVVGVVVAAPPRDPRDAMLPPAPPPPKTPARATAPSAPPSPNPPASPSPPSTARDRGEQGGRDGHDGQGGRDGRGTQGADAERGRRGDRDRGGGQEGREGPRGARDDRVPAHRRSSHASGPHAHPSGRPARSRAGGAREAPTRAGNGGRGGEHQRDRSGERT